MATTVASRKQKGRLLQQYAVASFLKSFPSLTADDVRSIPGSVPGTDIWFSTAAKEAIRLDDIECKCQEHLSFWQTIQQIEKRCFTSIRKCIIFKRNRSDVWTIIPFEFFIELLRKANNETDKKHSSDTGLAHSISSQESVRVSIEGSQQV